MSYPLRSGILILQNLPYQELVQRWQRVEALGFDTVWAADHYVDPYAPDSVWFDGWSLLAAMAVVTTHISIGTLVSSQTLRNPAMLAKQAMTVDHISNGRLVLGIGAGRAPLDHSMPGIPLWEQRERTRRFQEFAEIVHLMLNNQKTSFKGAYYAVSDAIMTPSPVQNPQPRLMIAAHGDQALKLTARLGDTWNTLLKFQASPDEALALARAQNDRLNEFCEEAGRDPSTVSRSMLCGLTQDHFFASREAFRERIGLYREIGFDEFIFYWLPDEKHPVFPNAAVDTITSHATLEWAAEELAALKAQ